MPEDGIRVGHLPCTHKALGSVPSLCLQIQGADSPCPAGFTTDLRSRAAMRPQDERQNHLKMEKEL